MLLAAQCRAARGLLDWSQQQLAAIAHVDIATVQHFEVNVECSSLGDASDRLRRAFEDAGIIFIAEDGEGAGLRLKKRFQTTTELTHRIDILEDDLAKTEGKSSQTPAGGMRTLERAHKRNTVTKLKNRRTKLRKQE
jgi:hypothetical protein